MPNLSIKDVPEEMAERLRQRAMRNHRSLQGELMAVIEQAALEEAALASRLGGAGGTVVGTGWGDRPIIRRGSKTIEQIAAEHRARFPEPITEGPMSVDIIRELRDSR